MSEDPRKKAVTDTTIDTDDEDEPFISRWSRRKALAREGVDPGEPEAEKPTAEPAADGGETDVSESDDDADGESPPAAVELPPLESLDEDSDYSAFLAADVAPDMQRQALRKLFHSPKFNVRDGLDDYDMDFTNPAPLGNVITAEMRYRIARELERLAARAAEGPASDEPAVAASAIEEPDAAQTDTDKDMEPDADDDRSDPA